MPQAVGTVHNWSKFVQFEVGRHKRTTCSPTPQKLKFNGLLTHNEGSGGLSTGAQAWSQRFGPI